MFYPWIDCFSICSLNILKENVSSCVCGFTLNNSIIKHCALTPSTGHYNSDTSYNFSKAGKCILILSSKPTTSRETHMLAHDTEKNDKAVGD